MAREYRSSIALGVGLLRNKRINDRAGCNDAGSAQESLTLLQSASFDE